MFDDFSGWIAVSVLAPAVFPSVANFVKLCCTDDTPENKALRDSLNGITAVKDGQLTWVAISLAVTGFHEMQLAASKGFVSVGYCLGLAFVLLASGIVFSEAASKPTPWPGTSIKKMRRLWMSVFILLIATGCCFGIHYKSDLSTVVANAWHVSKGHSH